ncbi:MAG: squalene/phytoene synthase family protein [Henriciella sp.]|nr:squalene/phytoene synthase family protein [Henriciella sp.]
MNQTASNLSTEKWKDLDQRLQRVDEDRWLSSRYAALKDRRALTCLYLLNYELARIRLAVTEAGLRPIRFQWWRENLESLATEGPAKLDLLAGLKQAIQSEQVSIPSLQLLVDGHERALEQGDRSLEPEAHLAATAARILVPAHGWRDAIDQVAPHVAALRRGEKVGFGPVVSKAPTQIRPAIAHFRLRRPMAKSDRRNGFARRVCVMLGVQTGRV